MMKRMKQAKINAPENARLQGKGHKWIWLSFTVRKDKMSRNRYSRES